MASFLARVGESIKKVDLYGQPVQLTYKDNPMFQTSCGGCVSLIFIVIMTTMFGFQCYELMTEPEFESYAPTYDFDQKQF